MPSALDQREVGRVGDQELALGVGQVADQLVAPVGGVGADHHGAGQGRRLEPEDELGHVVEQDGDVEGTVLARWRWSQAARAAARATTSA